ncbi:MAG: lysophospholipid acyltransferase family protein [Clostridia bacterium]|nr:lysophospholipid acyltransferase family protein [Clostridia bacterium]
MTVKTKYALAQKYVSLYMHPKFVFEDESVLKNGEAYVVVCNHMRAGDGILPRIALIEKRACSLMAKDILEKHSVLRLLVKGLDCIPIDRKAAATDWLRQCTALLKNGTSVVIFPEGTTLKTKEIEHFKSGFVFLAAAAKVKILPMAISKPYRPFKKDGPTVLVGKPQELELNGFRESEIQKECDRFEKIVTDMYLSLKNENNIKEENHEFTRLQQAE